MSPKENLTPDKVKCGTNETALADKETRDGAEKAARHNVADSIFTNLFRIPKYALRLSRDFFGREHTDVDITVKVLYGGRPGDILSQYVRFVQIYKEQYRRYGRTRRTVLETIRICIRENVLREYLESRREEVVTLMMTLFDQETAVEAYGRSLEKRGEKRCAKRINKLGQKLVSEGRMDDLQRSFTDEEFQQKLLKEYGL